MPHALLFILLIFTFAKEVHADTDYSKICGSFYVKDKKSLLFFDNLSFTKNEKILICGDNSTPGWEEIPDWQALKSVKSFLSSRGYFKPEIKEFEKGYLIDIGPQAEITSVTFKDTPDGFDEKGFIAIKDEVLTPSNLNQIEAWSKLQLEFLGYPCTTVETSASFETGDVEVDLNYGQRSILKELKREVPEGVRKKALSRFDAFDVGDYYNGKNFTLTSRRIQESGIADYSDFSTDCSVDSNERVFKQRITYSKPQSVVLAFGATTEQFPILKLSWQHSRLDHNASTFVSNLYASSVEQSISARVRWHVFNNFPRLYFSPEAKVARYSERVYTSINQAMSFGLGYMHDDSAKRILLSSKPTYTIEDRIDGEGPSHTEFLSLESSLSLFNHNFEYYQQSPRSGYQLNVNWSLREEGLGSDLSGSLVKIRGTYLHNWGGLEAPLYVFGVRFQYSFLSTPSLLNTPSRLRLYLGGNNDIRGFARKSINNEELGFRTTAYIGTELRLLRVLPFNLQPFLFVDHAQVGVDTFHLDSSPLWAPGLGLRWQSPVGPIRTTISKGIVGGTSSNTYDIEEQWTYFLSLGSEF